MKRILHILCSFSFTVGILSTLFVSLPAHAATSLNMMDDAIFDNTSSMSEPQIQSYLSTRDTTDFSGTSDQLCLSSYQTTDVNYSDATGWTYSGTTTAAALINKVAQFWGINPQVILATLQKEEALPHGTSCSTTRFNSAMGYDCPSGTLHDYPAIGVFGTCVAHQNYAGFTRQVLWGSFQLRFARLRSEGDGNLSWQGNGSINYVGQETAGSRSRYQGGPVTSFDGLDTLCDTSGANCTTYSLANGATASLVSYTPYYPQMFNYWFNETVSFTGGNAQCTNPDLVNVYRFWSPLYGNTHFFTINTGERDQLFNDPAWKYEGVGYCAAATPTTGYVPVYRFWSPKFGNTHFYTASESEKNNLLNDPNWQSEGIAFYEPISASTDTNAVPVARYWATNFSNDHFFTGWASEKNALSADRAWQSEGIGWYAELPQ